MKRICGLRFLSLLDFGDEINSLIKNKDEEKIRQRATKELIDLSGKDMTNHLSPLPFTAALISLMLIILFAFNTAFILHPFHLQPSFFAAIYFLTTLIFLLIVIFAGGMIARGKAVGLHVFGAAFVFIVFQFCVSASLQLIDREDQFVKKVIVFFIMFIAIGFCRKLMNGPSFIRFVLYRITMRLSIAARKITRN